MKEKRVLAMFITSAVTLVASLAVTFGVLMTLADPVVATGVVRYEYAFNKANNSLISSNGNTLKLSEDIIFQPASSVVWSDEEGKEAIWFNGSTYQDEIVFADESISTRLKVVPIRVSNNFANQIDITINVTYDKSTQLGKYTYVKLYSFSEGKFINYSATEPIEIGANSEVDYAIVICADDSKNVSPISVNWGTEWQNVNVEITYAN